MLTHRCHALRCDAPCKPEFLMCGAHWRQVPKKLQRAVWRTYRQGQCDDKNPSEAWHEAADAAIGAVALKEGCPYGKLRVPMVRALFRLAPECFGDDIHAVRAGIDKLDEEAEERRRDEAKGAK